MNEDRLRILKMVQEGKVSPEEGERLIEALGDAQPSGEAKPKKPKLLKIRVKEGDKTKVNVTIPISLAKLGLKFIPKDAQMTLGDQKIDLEEILRVIEEGVPDGKIVDVDDEDGNTKVEIVVE
jgi:hypothetical protein